MILIVSSCAPEHDYVTPIIGYYDSIVTEVLLIQGDGFYLFKHQIYDGSLQIKRTPNGLMFVESDNFYFTIFNDYVKYKDGYTSIDLLSRNHASNLFGEDDAGYLRVEGTIYNETNYRFSVTIQRENNIYTFTFKPKQE